MAGEGATSWVGREAIVQRLRWILGADERGDEPPCSSGAVLVHGPETTGKTAIVKAIVRETGCPCAYTSARACASPRNVMKSALDELSRAGWIAPPHNATCERPADLIALLDASRVDDGRTAYWIVDDAETLCTSGGAHNDRARFVTFLVQLSQLMLRPRPLCVILLSRVGWEAFQGGAAHEDCEPTCVFMPAYSVPQLQRILFGERRHLAAKQMATPPADADADADWRRFLAVVVPAVSHYTSSIHLTRFLAARLYPAWRTCAQASPLASLPASVSGGAPPGATTAPSDREMYAAFKPHLQRALQHMRTHGTSNAALAEHFDREAPMLSPRAKRPMEDASASTTLPFSTGGDSGERFVANLPYISRMLLVAAFVSGWNPSSADDRLFHGQRRMVKRRRNDPLLANRREDKARQTRLQGPGTFSMDRLLSVLRALVKLEGAGVPDGSQGAGGAAEDTEARFAAQQVHSMETYAQIRSLVASCVLSAAGADGSLHSDTLRLQCNLKEEAAHRLAKSVGVDLATYLVYV